MDVLHVPGGFGQEGPIDDEELLAWIRRQSAGAACVFSVCTGALLLGAAAGVVLSAGSGTPRGGDLGDDRVSALFSAT